MGTVALFFYFYKGLKPQQTTSLIPCLDHDIQLLLAVSKVVCCHYVLYMCKIATQERCLVSGGERDRGMLQWDVGTELPPFSGFEALIQWSGRRTHLQQQHPCCTYPQVLPLAQRATLQTTRESREHWRANPASIKADFKRLVCGVRLKGR